jgi:hypothetical protein
MEEVKRCGNSRCQKVKPLSEFHNDRRQSDGKAHYCKACARIRSKARTSKQNRSYNLKRYGITLDDYEWLLKTQNGRCAICGSDSPGKKETYFHIDHDHVTRKVRGLLCERCNIGIGYFTPESLEKAANYLRTFSANE